MSYRVEPLGDHRCDEFSCGTADLDDWLRHHAHTALGHGTRTYVMVDDEQAVVGYFAVAPHVLSRGDAPARLARGAPQHIPGVLLAKFALDSSVQGRGLGADLLVAALSVILEAARRVGGKIVVVDAIDATAHSFYLRHDFVPLPGRDNRLVMKLSSAAAALGVTWP